MVHVCHSCRNLDQCENPLGNCTSCFNVGALGSTCPKCKELVKSFVADAKGELLDEACMLNPVCLGAFMNPDLNPESHFNREHMDEAFVGNDKLHPWAQAWEVTELPKIAPELMFRTTIVDLMK